MILIDMSNIVFSSAVQYCNQTKQELDEGVLRHLILSKIISLKKILKKYDDGKIVLCFDSQTYWRKEKHPHYKGSRKKKRDESNFDWNLFFELWNKIYAEFVENIPYYCIRLENAEADDIIAILTMMHFHDHKIVIVSSDEDFLQLQHHCPKNVEQYSVKHKKFITPESQGYNLFEHIVKGDAGDGIPNILSKLDHFAMSDEKQKPISAKKILEWKSYGGISSPTEFCLDNDMLERFEMNRMLIDFTKIPKDIIESIQTQYADYKVAQGKLYKYCVKYKLTKILASGGLQ